MIFTLTVTGFGMIGHLTIPFIILGDGTIGIIGIDHITTMGGIDPIVHGIIGIIIGITVLLIIKGIMLYGIQVEEAAVDLILTGIELI